MFERCLFCRSPFRPNEVLQHFPTALRIAYDPARGRLWAICRRCGRWCLVPIESRWEAVEELEHVAKQRGLAARGDGISLIVHKGVRILRVGKGGQRQEAWWRYERQFRFRRLVRGPLVAGGVIGATTVAAVLWGMGPIAMLAGYMIGSLGPIALELNRITNFTGAAWRGRLTCRKCGATREHLGFREFRRLELVQGGAYGEVALRIPCPGCNRWSLRLKGLEAQHLIQRGLAYHHFFGAPTKRVEEAFDLIESAGSAGSFLIDVARKRRRLRDYAAAELIALEMAVSDAVEASVSTMTLEQQREVWRQEEELARIIDHELTPVGRSQTLEDEASRIRQERT